MRPPTVLDHRTPHQPRQTCGHSAPEATPHGSPNDRTVSARPRVSAIIPTRNRAHCLPRAIDSIYAQEGRGELFDVEIIVVDDASSDATPDVIRRYSGVRYIRLPERRGVTPALNAGLRASTGAYISFLGDDDEWLPHKLRVQVPEIEAHPDVGVVYGQSLIRKGGEERLYPELARAPSGWVFRAMLMDNFAGHHASTLIRRAAFDKVGDFDERLGSYEDYDLSLRIAFHFPFLFIPGAVDVYNLSPHGLWMTRAASGLAATDVVRVIEKALQMLPDSAAYAAVKREARARAALGAIYPFLEMGDSAQAWTKLMAALRSCPWLVRYDWARETVCQLTYTQARAAESPVATTRDLCAQIKTATAKSGTREQRWVRKIVAMVWGQLALSFASDPATSDRHTAYAAVRAVAHAPLYLLRRELLRGGARDVIRRRLGGWYREVKRVMMVRRISRR